MRIPSSALLVVLVVGAFIWRGHAVPQGFCGSVVRWFNGELGVMEAANDMAEELRTDPDLANLQPWAVETLARFQQGQVLTNAPPDYMSNWQRVPPRLAASEVPDFLTRRWSGTNGMGETEPIVTIPASDETRPAYLVIDWRCYSIVVGPPEFIIPGQYSNAYVKAKPGIYVSAYSR